jgi:two-component system, NtrC family, sensor kinase
MIRRLLYAKIYKRLLKLKSLLEQVPEALEDSAEGLRTVSRIVRAMKEFSHPGTEDKSPVDVNHALETTLTVSANEWKYVTTVDTDFDPDLTTVPAFPGELNQVFLNLIVNGAHAIADCVGSDGSEKGKIIVATKAGVDYVEVRISDSGSGIPEHIQNRVFDPFFTTKEVGKGTGQGLAIAYDVIVKKHGGKLWFETTAGEGTSFFIELPSIDPTEMAAEADSMEAEPVESSV